MLDYNSTTCPMEAGLKLSKDEEGNQVDPTTYRRIIVCVHYCYIHGSYMQKPKKSHLIAIP